MRKRIRRSLFIAGALLAMVTLLASGAAAQPGAITGVMASPPADSHDKLTVTWGYAHTDGTLEAHLAANNGALQDLGFFVYYTKGMDTNSLNSVTKLAAAMQVDAGLGKAAKRMESTDVDPGTATTAGTTFEYDLKGLDPGTDYVVTVIAYSTPLKVQATTAIAAADTGKTGTAPAPSMVRDVEAMPGDKMLMVSWQAPVRAGGGDPMISVDRYEVRWRWSQTADHMSGDWTMYPPATDKTTKLKDMMYKITALDNDVSYDVQVRAINDAKGVGPWSPAEPGVRATPTAGDMPTPTPALPLFGAIALGAGVVAAGRARLRRRAQRQLTR